tara:strand:+ start:995 stop:1672 length:678 start_codon:yes stop_codon:yes gene_type:complete
MCTLTVLPSAVGTIVTMNRDEADDRAEAGEYLLNDERGIMQQWWPIDSVSRGTWFGARGDGLVAALLNRYQGSSAAARRSRGLIIPALLADAPKDALVSYIMDLSWDDFAPFDLVLVRGERISQCSWEGGRMQIHEEGAERPFFLSSSSVEYEASLQVRREAFEQFIARSTISPERVIEDLHRQPYPQDPSLGFLMRRPGRRTKSISQIVNTAAGTQKLYIPLQH